MPSSAMSLSSRAVRRWMPSNSTSPLCGRVLPVTTSIMVVLPAPLGPMMARISPGSIVNDSSLSARKPSNETETPSRYKSAEVSRACIAVSLRQCRRAGRLGVGIRHFRFAAVPQQMPDGTDDTARQQQGHADEQAAEHKQPIGGECAGGEIRLAVVDNHGAEDRTRQRAAPSNRDPDHLLDGVGGCEFARIDEAHLGHVKRAGEARDAGGQREHEKLVRLNLVAEKAGTRFGIADRDQYFAEFRRNDRMAHCERRSEERAGDAKQRVAGTGGLDVEAEYVLEVGEAVIAAKAKIVAEEAEHQREGERLGDDRQIDAGNAAAERE